MTEIIWKWETYSNYTINEQGQIFSKRINAFIKPIERVKINGVMIPVAQLMSNLFLNGDKMMAKNGDKTDNRLENLIPFVRKTVIVRGTHVYHNGKEYININDAWENAFPNERPTKCTLAYWIKEGKNGWSKNLKSEPDCEYKQLDKYSNYKFYSDGTVWSISKNVAISQVGNNVKLYNDETQTQVHVNIPNTLETLFRIENPNKKSPKVEKPKIDNSVVILDAETNEEINTYSSIRQAEVSGISCRKTLTRALNEKRSFESDGKKYLIMKKGDKPFVPATTREITKSSIGVTKINKNGKETTFKSQTEAAKDAGVSVSYIGTIIKTGHDQYGNTYKSTGYQNYKEKVPLEPKQNLTTTLSEDDMDSCDSEDSESEDERRTIPGYDEKYTVTRTGKVYNGEKLMNVLKNREYEEVFIDTHVKIHRLVALAFKKNPHSLKIVNHKDGNKRNNSADNLEWCTQQHNSIHSCSTLKNKSGRRVRKVTDDSETIFDSVTEAMKDCGVSMRIFLKHIGGDTYRGAKWSYVDNHDTVATGEYRVLDEYPQYQIYDSGKIWSLYKNRFLIQQQNHDGYMVINLTNRDNISKNKFVHRFVCTAFHGEKPSANHVVNHIDSNRNNNCADNLEWVTQSENMVHAVKHGNAKSTSVYKRNKNGDIVESYISIGQAAKSIDATTTRITSACKRRKTYKGFYWDFEENKNRTIEN